MNDFLKMFAHPQPIVVADAHMVSLHFRPGELQSLMSVQCPTQLEIAYTKTMMGFLLISPNPIHILMIGLGGGSLAKFCYQHLPNTRITVVEINPHVIALRKRFEIPDDDERFTIVCADGADFVRDARQDFDVVLVDGFDSQGSSTQLCTCDFYENVSRLLLPKGVMVVNLDGDHPAHNVFLQRIHTTYKGNSVEIRVEDRGNHIIFATKNVEIVSRSMSLSWTLGHHAIDVQQQLKAEFQRILRLLDSLDIASPTVNQSQATHLH